MARQRLLGVVLAGGAGRRLGPLTADRAKSAVPFGGIYRVLDFTLSNLVNGGVQRICVLTQYKSHSLNRHITTTWQLNSLLDNYVTPVPAQQWLGPRWQTGSADAIYQSLTLIERDRPGLLRQRVAADDLRGNHCRRCRDPAVRLHHVHDRDGRAVADPGSGHRRDRPHRQRQEGRLNSPRDPADRLNRVRRSPLLAD